MPVTPIAFVRGVAVIERLPVDAEDALLGYAKPGSVRPT